MPSTKTAPVLLFCEAKRRDGGTEALLVLDSPNWCGTSVGMTLGMWHCFGRDDPSGITLRYPTGQAAMNIEYRTRNFE
ncbi:MAG TPA: hypothetical protein HPP66_01410 [Planctomycetes bacterium]|nr:hypothetical protein [Planctomycetota bacterium]